MNNTIHTRLFAAAYLLNSDRILLMKRADTHKLFPSVWAPVGGHIEPHELNRPEAACLREVAEETGICPADINELTLKYITIRIKGNEIRQQYLYFGRITLTEFSSCPEGELHLVPIAELLNRPLSIVNRMTLEHYLEHGQHTSDVIVGTVSESEGLPHITWVPLQDWGDFPV